MVTRVVLSLALASLLWIIFAASTNPHELVVGAVCVVATAAFTALVGRTMSLHLEFRARDVAQGWRIPWYVISRVVEITWILILDFLRIAPADNLFRVCGFDSSKHDPVRMSRTALAIAYTTMAPNFIVLGVDISQSRMLFHQISASRVSPMTIKLGAKG